MTFKSIEKTLHRKLFTGPAWQVWFRYISSGKMYAYYVEGNLNTPTIFVLGDSFS